MAVFTIDLLKGNPYLLMGNFGTGGTTTFSGITTAVNGLSLVGSTQVKLGGTLNQTTTMTRGGGNVAGIEYGGNYSSDYTNRSLVDKEYVLSQTSGSTIPDISGATNGLNFVNKTVALGGTLTGDTVINLNNNNLIFNSSGYTGFNTLAPTLQIHTYGVDTTLADGWNIQSNGIKVDGALDTDKNIVWADEGINKWAAQTYRGERGQFWYLFNIESKNNPITVSETGSVGINKQANTLNYHSLFDGTGLSDLVITGDYQQNYNTVYSIQILNNGTPDTFHWKKSYDNGITYTAYSPSSGCTLAPVELEYGVMINFEHLTGHTIGDAWTFVGFSQVPQASLIIAPLDLDEVQTTNDYTAPVIIYNDITGEANGGPLGNTFEVFSTGITGTKQALMWGTNIKLNSVNFNIHQGGESIILVTEYWNGSNWIALNFNDNNYIDSTDDLSHSGRIIWTPKSTTNWIPSYLPNLIEPGYELYWMRIRTSTNPTVSPLVHNIAAGNDKRFAIYGSQNDYVPNFYVDSEGRTNIGGGNITGTNVLQINVDQNTPVTSGGVNSLVEFDSEDSSAIDLKIKLSSNDLIGPALLLVKTSGTLAAPADTLFGSNLGHIDFRGRTGNAGLLLSQIRSDYMGSGGTKHADIIFSTAHGSDPVDRLRIQHNGNVAFGLSAATATINIKAGTSVANTAPLKFTSGSLLSSPETGAIEFLTDKYYGTITSGSARKTFAFLESPVFTGAPDLPIGTTLNSNSLSNYILVSGGTNNPTMVRTSTFNSYTGGTQNVINKAITGVTNGLSKSSCHDVILGGVLTQDTVLSGNTFNFSISAKALNLCAVNGICISDISGTGVDVHSNGGTVDVRGNNSSGIEKIKLRISDTQATFTDSRSIPVGIQYNADYSTSYTARSLVDKAYVDSVVSGFNPLSAVEVATTGNTNLVSAPSTIGGVTLTAGMRILVKNQISGATNGIYDFNGAGNPLTRSSDFDTSAEVLQNTMVSVLSGATNKNTTWILTTPNPINLGVTPLTWVLFSIQSGVVQGNGICVTQSGGNYNISTKSPANSGLCSDPTGIYINPNIGGTGICYLVGTLSVNGSALAGNSLSWSGTQFNVNISGGTLSTALSSKVNTSTYATYTGNTLTSINSKVSTTTYGTYTGTTAPNQFASKSFLNTYTGTTVPNTYYNKTQINTYTGATSTAIGLKAPITSPTFLVSARSVTPATNDNTTCVATTAWYIGQAGAASPLMDGSVAVGTSNLFSRQDHVHPSDTSRISTTTFSTYTGTTVPNTYYNKTQINAYTGTTAPKANPVFSGAVKLNASFNYVLDNSGGGNDTYTATDAALTLVTGMVILFKPLTNNTGACTLNLNGTGAKNILTTAGTNPGNNVINTNGLMLMAYKGTSWILIGF